MTAPATRIPDAMIPAGRGWCAEFATERTTASLRKPFRAHVQDFIAALEQGRRTPQGARCRVRITATRRPEQRAWLMRQAWDIVKSKKDPAKITPRADIPIEWSRTGAQEMFDTYELVARPSLTSRHIEGRAVDMTIEGWPGTRAELDAFGREFGCFPLAGDPVHWSDDGR